MVVLVVASGRISLTISVFLANLSVYSHLDSVCQSFGTQLNNRIVFEMLPEA